MASLVSNFILQTCSAPGTAANCNLIAAPTGRLNFSAKFANGATCFYFADDGTNVEWGIATLTTGSPDVLSRTTVIGNSAGTTSRLNFAGTTRFYNEVPGENLVYLDASGTINAGLVSLTEPSNGSQTLALTSSGTNGVNIKLTGNGATTPTKYIRVISGALQIVNSANSATILTLTDAGGLTVPTASVGGLTTTGTTGLTLSNATSNLINFGTHGQAGPSFTTRSAGTKIVLYDALTGSLTDYAIGISAGNLWFSLATTSGTNFIWYGGTTQIALLNGTGSLNIAGTMQAGSGASGGGYLCKAGALGSFSGNAFNEFWNGTGVDLWIDSTKIGQISVTSDQRYKQNVVALEDNATDRLMNLKPISYRFKDKGIFLDDGQTREGFIAQDVQQVIPSAVNGNEQDDHPMNLDVIPIVAVTVKSLQELKTRIDDMEARLVRLEAA